ncbi:Hypothetical predicted protein [Olea europaea subsp. europaea]|uniref:Uncharacterized protein n=1 Tax=Olea europaea subsp. europaea TaxID=158383 RepID=A0A8S0Q6N2_OLEEU|nr:Hypothetical predicted protein [Olea europaea subsp. europaea]
MPPQFMKDLKTPVIDKDQNQKSGKFNGLEDDDMTDDELDEFDDEFKNGDILKFKLEMLFPAQISIQSLHFPELKCLQSL